MYCYCIASLITYVPLFCIKWNKISLIYYVCLSHVGMFNDHVSEFVIREVVYGHRTLFNISLGKMFVLGGGGGGGGGGVLHFKNCFLKSSKPPSLVPCDQWGTIVTLSVSWCLIILLLDDTFKQWIDLDDKLVFRDTSISQRKSPVSMTCSLTWGRCTILGCKSSYHNESSHRVSLEDGFYSIVPLDHYPIGCYLYNNFGEHSLIFVRFEVGQTLHNGANRRL